jgi:16S rRNA (guanine527-N7)-methyltransferase
MLIIDSNNLLDKYIEPSALDYYLHEVITANEKFNLFSRQRTAQDLKLLVAESLLLLECELVNGASEPILDIGSGWGIPALPLLLNNKNLRLTLLERSQKKADFLRLLLNRLGLKAEVIQLDLLAFSPKTRFKTVLARQVNLTARIMHVLNMMTEPESALYSFRQTVPCKLSGRSSSISYKIDQLPSRRIIKIPIP